MAMAAAVHRFLGVFPAPSTPTPPPPPPPRQLSPRPHHIPPSLVRCCSSSPVCAATVAVAQPQEFVVVTFYKFVSIDDPRAEVSRHLHSLQVPIPSLPLPLPSSPLCEIVAANKARFDCTKNLYVLVSLSQGRDIHGRIYMNEQGMNAQVKQASVSFLSFFSYIALVLPPTWSTTVFTMSFIII